MNLNFAPRRDELEREVELCVSLNKLDTLDSLCKGCLNRISGSSLPSSCHTCTVQVGKEAIQKRIH